MVRFLLLIRLHKIEAIERLNFSVDSGFTLIVKTSDTVFDKPNDLEVLV